MTEHTPGPWTVEGAMSDGGYQITNGRDLVICSRNPIEHIWQESNANAFLMAAAPDMLAALQDCLREHGGFTIRGDCERNARAAIAKATGRDGAVDKMETSCYIKP